MPGMRRGTFGMRLALQAAREAEARGIPAEERLAELQAEIRERREHSAALQPWREAEWARCAEQNEAAAKAMDRREFIRRGAVLGAGAAAFSFAFIKNSEARAAPRSRNPIVVVGAGIAGMAAAYRIRKTTGHKVWVYEGRSRTGGRTWTDPGTAFLNGQKFEHGGGGVNSNETAYLNFFQTELNLGPKVDTWLNYPAGTTDHWYAGVHYTDTQMASNGLKAAATTAAAQLATMVWPARYNNRNANNDFFDNMTADDWINTYVTGGRNGATGKELAGAVCGVDYAGVSTDQSAIPLMFELGGTWLYADATYDEEWAVPGGNDQTAAACAAFLPGGSVKYGTKLVAIKQNFPAIGTSYTLTFDNGSLHEVQAAHVVLAIPPACLRQVDYSQAGFGPVTNQWIQNVQAGTNSKYNLQFTGQPWGQSPGSKCGDAMTDQINCYNWQSSYAAPLSTAILTGMTSGITPPPADPAHAAMSTSVKNAFLAQFDFQYQNRCTPAFIQAYHDQWMNDPFSLGTYSYYRPGAFTNYAGSEYQAQGRVHFAGEHAWDGSNNGYQERGMMASAYISGERAAQEVIAAL